MKIVTVVGARPQFIKAAPVSKALNSAGHTEYLVHTGQHYDYGMSQIFFDELAIPQPDINLCVGSSNHGRQTGQMLIRLEEVILEQQPDWVLVYGDTNSTLAGALAAAKLNVPLAHVEAGLRSFNRIMPEEHNRVLTDHCADLLFCPTETAVQNLAKEGIKKGVYRVGDCMYDAVLDFAKRAGQQSKILETLAIEPKKYLLATLHRPYNTDNKEILSSILSAFADLKETIVFPVHPRTRKKITAFGISHLIENGSVQMIDPIGYFDMLVLEKNAQMILTDSGGIQKEAYFFAVPCVTLRSETEWLETVQTGWNVLTGADHDKIVSTVKSFVRPHEHSPLYGDGNTAIHIRDILTDSA